MDRKQVHRIIVLEWGRGRICCCWDKSREFNLKFPSNWYSEIFPFRVRFLLLLLDFHIIRCTIHTFTHTHTLGMQWGALAVGLSKYSFFFCRGRAFVRTDEECSRCWLPNAILLFMISCLPAKAVQAAAAAARTHNNSIRHRSLFLLLGHKNVHSHRCLLPTPNPPASTSHTPQMISASSLQSVWFNYDRGVAVLCLGSHFFCIVGGNNIKSMDTYIDLSLAITIGVSCCCWPIQYLLAFSSKGFLSMASLSN